MLLANVIAFIVAYATIPFVIAGIALHVHRRNSQRDFARILFASGMIVGPVVAFAVLRAIDLSKYPQTDFVFGVVLVMWFAAIGGLFGAIIDRFRMESAAPRAATMLPVTITLSRDEALVLEDVLSRFNETNVLGTEDQAEQRALRNLGHLLEQRVRPSREPTDRDLLIAARNSLRDAGGSDAESERLAGHLAFWLRPDAIAFIANEWRKLPRDMPDDDRQEWADIAFRAMSALHKAGIHYTPQTPRHGYHLGDPPSDTG